MPNVPHVVRVRCHFCSRERAIWQVHRLAGNSQVLCEDCLDWHQRGIEFLAGNAMPGCQSCLSTWERLRDQTLGEHVRLYVVPKDGIYQVLCEACIRPYTEKRADLYRGTRFGAKIGRL